MYCYLSDYDSYYFPSSTIKMVFGLFEMKTIKKSDLIADNDDVNKKSK